MSLTAGEYNQKYTDELDETFNKLEGYEDIEERLGYTDSEKQISDDLVIIKNSVLDIYSSDIKVDWSLIKPLKIKLNQLSKNLDYFEKSLKNEEFVKTSTINETRTLVKDIGNIKLSSGGNLKDNYGNGGLNQMKVETLNIYNSQINKLTDIVNNLWESDNKISDLEKESSDLIKNFCNDCDIYFEKNKEIFNGIKSKDEREKFVIDGFIEIIDKGIGPSKFKILLGKKFDILDTIEEYSVTLFELIQDYGLQEIVINYFKKNLL